MDADKSTKNMKALLFWWLQNQRFYKNLQEKAVEPIALSDTHKIWADIGCSTGLLSRLAHKLNYTVVGYDIDYFSIQLAKLLALDLDNVTYKKQDFYTLNTHFDIVSATSLLSVVDNKAEALKKLVSLLREDTSILILIEPTKNLSVQNVWNLISDFQTFWFYKGLLLWAKARENKYSVETIFRELDSVHISHKFYLEDMICITYIHRAVV